MSEIIVIGGGAAGMMAAITAARQGAGVTLLEPNARVGKKLNITGKGRCNVTQHLGIFNTLLLCCFTNFISDRINHY